MICELGYLQTRCRVFTRQRGKKDNNDLFYRITQFGAERLFALMTKRTVKITMDELLLLAHER